jgi:FKBP-type peptidyl-prolyl cis-trans isomerase FkpA
MRRTLAVLVALLLVACSEGGESAGEGGGETTASGLEIIHLVEGSGEGPGATDTVVVHYHGTFPDGKVFDSSVDRGQPATFPLNRVIPCWTEGVQLIKPGGKATLICPPEIAYGAGGAPPRIPANATLHFDVELIEVKGR